MNTETILDNIGLEDQRNAIIAAHKSDYLAYYRDYDSEDFDDNDLAEFALDSLESIISADMDNYVEYMTEHDDSGSDYLVCCLADSVAYREDAVWSDLKRLVTGSGTDDNGYVYYGYDANTAYLGTKFGLDPVNGWAFFEQHRDEIINGMIEVAEPVAGNAYSAGSTNDRLELDAYPLGEIEFQVDLDFISERLSASYGFGLPSSMLDRKALFDALEERSRLCLRYTDGVKGTHYEDLLVYETTDACWLAVVTLEQIVDIISDIKERYQEDSDD